MARGRAQSKTARRSSGEAARDCKSTAVAPVGDSISVIPGGISVFIPWQPERSLSPNVSCHWYLRAAARGTARLAAQGAMLTALAGRGDSLPPEWATGPVLVQWEVTWGKGRRRMDQDNLLAVLKPYQDGVADALGVADAQFVVAPPRQSRAADAGSSGVWVTLSPCSHTGCVAETG